MPIPSDLDLDTQPDQGQLSHKIEVKLSSPQPTIHKQHKNISTNSDARLSLKVNTNFWAKKYQISDII